MRRLVDFTIRQVRRVVVAVVGGTVIALGLVMIVTPGPAFLVIPLGLAILGTEFVWAKRLMKHVKERVGQAVKGKGKAEGEDTGS